MASACSASSPRSTRSGRFIISSSSEEGSPVRTRAGKSVADLAVGEPRGVLVHDLDGFFDSDDARPLRILAEYLQPLYRFKKERVHDTVVFFGSARIRPGGPLGRYYGEARQLARRLTEWSNTLPGDRRFVVCSGGGSGLME